MHSAFTSAEEALEDIKFYQWEQNEENQIEKVLCYGDYCEVFEMLKSQLCSFLIHIYVKRLQQQHFESLRDNVDGKEILIQLDFSENFSFTEQNAVQSAHWTNKHLWVEKNQIQSSTYVSDCLNHDKVAVHKYVHSVLLFVRETYDQVEKINFFSDGPSSQFQQKYLFSNFEYWEKEFKYKIHCYFFAKSHGKGVVDGIGGSVKGSMHRKILAGRVIQTAKQVAEIAQESYTNVIIQYVSADEIAEDKNMLDERWKYIKTLPGTQKIHSVMSANDGQVRGC